MFPVLSKSFVGKGAKDILAGGLMAAFKPFKKMINIGNIIFDSSRRNFLSFKMISERFRQVYHFNYRKFYLASNYTELYEIIWPNDYYNKTLKEVSRGKFV